MKLIWEEEQSVGPLPHMAYRASLTEENEALEAYLKVQGFYDKKTRVALLLGSITPKPDNYSYTYGEDGFARQWLRRLDIFATREALTRRMIKIGDRWKKETLAAFATIPFIVRCQYHYIGSCQGQGESRVIREGGKVILPEGWGTNGTYLQCPVCRARLLEP
jgi:hypothetical protein